MKNLLILLTTSTLMANGFAQFTQGGTYKNYEKYHIQYDTIVTERTYTETNTMGTAGYFFINIGPAIPFGPFANRPTTSTSFSQDYNGAGGLGGSTGFDIGIGGVEGIRGINKHLIPLIDLGVYNAANFTYLPWSYDDIGFPSDQEYEAFMAINFSVGPALMLNPIKNVDFHIDLIYKIGLGATFGGGMTNPNYYFDIERTDVGLSFYHGPNLYLRYSFLMVGFELNLLNDYGYFSFYDGANSTYWSSSVALNSFSVKVGATF